MPHRIFLVEDEPVIATGIARKVEQLGYQLTGSAATGESAVRQVDQDPPDLVLMDIKLEGRMDGIEAAGLIFRKHDVPVVFLTAYADEATLARATQQDPFGYLVKPFTDRELAGAVEVSIHRHALDRALREREERYRMLSEVLSDFAFCLRIAPDPENDRLEWSVGSIEEVFGIAVDGFRSAQDILHLVHPDDVTSLRSFWTLLRGGSGGKTEFRVVPPSGAHRWVKMDGKVSRPAAGGAHLVYGAFQDVSDLRRTEQQLEEREFEFSQIVQSLRQGIWVGDAEELCIYANQALCDLSGYAREDLIGSTRIGSILAETEDTDRNTVYSESGSESAFETELIRRGGERIPVLVTPRTIRAADRSIRGSFYLIVDVSRQRRAMQALERGRRKLEGVFHRSPEPTLLIDSATNAVLGANDAFTRLTGFHAEELVGTGGFGLADYSNLDDLNRMVSLLKERSSRARTVRLRTRGGSPGLFAVDVQEIVVDDEELLLLIFSPSEDR